MKRKICFCAVIIEKGDDGRLSALFSSRAEAIIYARCTNRMMKKSGWKASIVELPNAEAYVFAQKEKNELYAAAATELCL